jgi:hypothetical protein
VLAAEVVAGDGVVARDVPARILGEEVRQRLDWTAHVKGVLKLMETANEGGRRIFDLGDPYYAEGEHAPLPRAGDLVRAGPGVIGR